MQIHHIALRTTDVGRLESFYAGVLGLSVVRRSGDRSVWLAAGEAIVMLERAEPGEPPCPRGSMELLAFAVAPSEHEAFASRLRAASIDVESESSFTLYFRDPDGRRVGVSHYPDART